MQRTIIADTSCLILLNKIDELSLLHNLFGSILITPEISAEFNHPLPDWFIIQSSANKTYQKILATSMDIHSRQATDCIPGFWISYDVSFCKEYSL